MSGGGRGLRPDAAREVLLREALGGEGRNGERVAEGERCGRGRGRRQIERAGFAADVAVEMHIGVLGEAGVRVARDGDERRALALERGDDGEKLVGFAGVRDGEHDVVGVIMPRSPWAASAAWTK